MAASSWPTSATSRSGSELLNHDIEGRRVYHLSLDGRYRREFRLALPEGQQAPNISGRNGDWRFDYLGCGLLRARPGTNRDTVFRVVHGHARCPNGTRLYSLHLDVALFPVTPADIRDRIKRNALESGESERAPMERESADTAGSRQSLAAAAPQPFIAASAAQVPPDWHRVAVSPCTRVGVIAR